MLSRSLLSALRAHNQQQQQLLLPLLQQFQHQHASVQHALQAASNGTSNSCSQAPFQHLQLASYAQRPNKMNPKERKAKTKVDKRAIKKSAVPQGTASASDGAVSFEDEIQAVEPDVTRLVLQAIHNITPVLDVRVLRTVMTVKHVPGLMPPGRARSIALHWLVKAVDARKRSTNASYAECLALELLLAYQKRGGARQKRDDLHKLALQNRANVLLRWW